LTWLATDTKIIGIPAATEVKSMADYRAYTIGHNGHFSDCEARSWDQDSDAIEWAKRLVKGYTIELWCGERFVAKIEPKPE
jgi:hypothetical protein